MSTTKTSLTVTFEAPFWIGLYERESDGAYEVCKITFGAEPKDYEVYEFLLRNWHGLSFSPKLQSSTLSERRLNPTSARTARYRHKGAGGAQAST